MRRLILIAALALVSASAQAGGTDSLSTGATMNDPPAATKTQPKSGALSAQTDSTATPAPASPPPAVETPRYAPPVEASKALDARRNTETPVQNPAEAPVQSETPPYTAPPAAVDRRPTAATAPSTRQHMPPREARYRRGRTRYATAYGSGYRSDHGWGYGRPYFGPHRWSTWRIIATLHDYGIYW